MFHNFMLMLPSRIDLKHNVLNKIQFNIININSSKIYPETLSTFLCVSNINTYILFIDLLT